MSRIGNKIIEIPAGVTIEIKDCLVIVSGAKGKLEREIDRNIFLKQEGNTLTVSRKSEDKRIKALHGLSRALINNMVVGVSQGFSKKLNVKGVGFKLIKSGNELTLNLGFSHPIKVVEPAGIKIETNGTTEIVVSGIDKELVGSVAADIKGLKPVEPYHNYGIHYDGEKVIRKQGKKAGAKK